MPRTKSQNASRSKLYNFTHFKVIDGWAKAKCAHIYNGRRVSESELIEEIILREILPQHPLANKLVSERLFADDGGTQVFLLALFEAAGYGINVPDNLLPLAEFARQQELDAHTILTDEKRILLPEMEAPLAQLADAFHALLCELEDNTCKIKEDVNFRIELELTRQLLDSLKEAPHQVVLCNFYQTVIKYWDCVSDRRKYSVMIGLVKIANMWRDAPVYAEKRIELLDIVKKVSAEWAENAFTI